MSFGRGGAFPVNKAWPPNLFPASKCSILELSNEVYCFLHSFAKLLKTEKRKILLHDAM